MTAGQFLGAKDHKDGVKDDTGKLMAMVRAAAAGFHAVGALAKMARDHRAGVKRVPEGWEQEMDQLRVVASDALPGYLWGRSALALPLAIRWEGMQPFGPPDPPLPEEDKNDTAMTEALDGIEAPGHFENDLREFWELGFSDKDCREMAADRRGDLRLAAYWV